MSRNSHLLPESLIQFFICLLHVFSMVWLDKKGEYNISHAEGTTRSVDTGSREGALSSVLLHTKISLDWIATGSETNNEINQNILLVIK